MIHPPPDPRDAHLNHPWSLTADQVLAKWGASLEIGLPADEVTRRQRQYGPNQLREHPRKSVWSILANQFHSLIVVLLLIAAGVGFLSGEHLSGIAVLVVILLNATIGFFTELRAIRSMEALFSLSHVTTRVRREGEVREIPAEQLVPGDLVVFEGGDMITADIRLVEASRLQADESTLTGESLPIAKSTDPVGENALLAERSSMLYKGTAVTRGAGAGIVVAIGMETELGQISALVAQADDEATPLERRLDQLAHRLIWFTVGIAALVTVTGTLAGKDLLLMIQTGLALAVAAIPEGLPVVATIALGRGMHRMAKRNALINRLSSVETLGATSVICTDKTGTLTENRMTVVSLALPGATLNVDEDWDSPFQDESGQPCSETARTLLQRALETAVLCNDAALGEGADTKFPNATGDPLEVALLQAGLLAGIDRKELLVQFPEVREDAFDADIKMMSTLHRFEGGFREAVKGAPEEILKHSSHVWTEKGAQPLDEASREQWLTRNNELAGEGQRVIGLATRDYGSEPLPPYQSLALIGWVGLEDPPREEVRGAIQQCHGAGIQVVMVTGDQPVTALGIGRHVGLVGADEDVNVIHGSDLKPPAEMNESEKESQLKARLFARVTPRQKLELIELHQQAGRIVAMTGDGVNDAPALKKADIGIAMGKRGTQVAREASDMVLQDDSFATIVHAIREGRGIFLNIRSFVMYLMSCNVSEVLVVGLASLIGTTLPILPLQILFLNLVTDVFPALALGVGPGDDRLMSQPPRQKGEPILGAFRWFQVAAYGAVFTVSVLGALWLARGWLGLSPEAGVTISFLTLAFAQLWHVFNMRADEASWWFNDVTRNAWVWGALVLCCLLILLALYVPFFARILDLHPPDTRGWLVVIGMSLIPLGVGQIVKSLFATFATRQGFG